LFSHLAVPPKGPLQKHIQRGEFDLVLENMVHLHLDNQLFPEGGDSRNRLFLSAIAFSICPFLLANQPKSA